MRRAAGPEDDPIFEIEDEALWKMEKETDEDYGDAEHRGAVPGTEPVDGSPPRKGA